MLCGMSRLSLRSLTATATFFAVAVGVVQFLNPQQGHRSVSGSPQFDPVAVLLLQIPLLLYRYVLPKRILTRAADYRVRSPSGELPLHTDRTFEVCQPSLPAAMTTSQGRVRKWCKPHRAHITEWSLTVGSRPRAATA